VLAAAGWKEDVFNWEQYLSRCDAEAAPADLFATVIFCFVVLISPAFITAICLYRFSALTLLVG